jgi:hypothetical protein
MRRVRLSVAMSQLTNPRIDNISRRATWGSWDTSLFSREFSKILVRISLGYLDTPRRTQHHGGVKPGLA